ncbi:hypothetical protein M378DRAFT_162439 [Amanita muscaria Koide BX008]|uniref:DUF6533 domain-containing protein n=1 Tax=Amanita muscaria (strain Koide BX008) TaxID=946122 RepID=A0A0C2X8T7_AMAMK|nr:hypothetical protein M378DRAFT_162439 [Amanita muscaria Koide BX008]
MALMVYDHLHTLPMEIRYMWSSRRLTIVNVLYYITKYGILFSVADLYRVFNRSMTVQECQYTAYIYSILTLTSWAGEAVLGIRIWAIWGKKRILTIALPIIFWALFTTDFVFILNYIGSLEYGPSPAPQLISCFVTKANNNMDVILVCMPAWVALMSILLTTSAYLAYKSGGNTRFIRMIYQEGIIYYFYLLLLHGGNLVITYRASAPPPVVASFLSGPVCFLHVALASRVILHIRKQANMRLHATDHVRDEEIWT